MPSVYIKKGETPEGKERRLRAFRHNGYLGYTSMGQRHMVEIIDSDTATPETKQTAHDVLLGLQLLSAQLRTRVD